MKDAVAARYAEALFNVAREQNKVQKFREEYSFAMNVLNFKPQLKIILTHPLIHADEKKAILKGIFSGKISSSILNFLFILVDNKRLEFLERINDHFQEMSGKALGMKKAVIVSAVSLTLEEKRKIKAAFEKKLGIRLKPRYIVENGILGGVIVRIEDKVYDGSIKHQLNRIEQKLINVLEVQRTRFTR